VAACSSAHVAPTASCNTIFAHHLRGRMSRIMRPSSSSGRLGRGRSSSPTETARAGAGMDVAPRPRSTLLRTVLGIVARLLRLCKQRGAKRDALLVQQLLLLT
jgi:hypothetical protein